MVTVTNGCTSSTTLDDPHSSSKSQHTLARAHTHSWLHPCRLSKLYSVFPLSSNRTTLKQMRERQRNIFCGVENSTIAVCFLPFFFLWCFFFALNCENFLSRFIKALWLFCSFHLFFINMRVKFNVMIQTEEICVLEDAVRVSYILFWRHNIVSDMIGNPEMSGVVFSRRSFFFC